MEKIITCTVSSLSYCIIIAQPAATSKVFSTQLKELLHYAKRNFKNIPPNYKLEGSISSKIKNTGDNILFCRSLIANKVSIKKSKELIKQWSIKIEHALGDGYEMYKETSTKEIIFKNKSADGVDIIRLFTKVISNQCEIYLDISHKRKAAKGNYK